MCLLNSSSRVDLNLSPFLYFGEIKKSGSFFSTLFSSKSITESEKFKKAHRSNGISLLSQIT